MGDAGIEVRLLTVLWYLVYAYTCTSSVYFVKAGTYCVYEYLFMLCICQDISIKSDLSKVLAKVEEKFRLDLTDEQAEQYFLSLIDDSLNALAPRVLEVLHRVAVARR